MREMKDSGIEWIGQIPTNWDVVPHKRVMHKVKEICEQYNGEDIISLTMNGVIKRDLTAGGKMPTSFDGYQYVKPNDLLLCLFDIDVTPRCVGVVKDYGVTSPAYSRFVMHDGYYNAYYDYLLRAIDDDKVFVHLSKNLRSSLTESDFGAIKTCVPSLAEQKRIAAFLDAECAEIDTVLEKTRASIEEYKKLKQAIITQAVTKGVRGDRPMKNSGIEWIGDIPAEWKVASIGRFCFVTKLAGFEFTNDMMSNIQDSGDIPIVRAQNIKMGKFINNISEFIPYRISQKLERCALNRKCLIITFIGAGIGEVAIFNEPKRYHLAPNVAKIVINVGMEHFVTEEYLLYFLMSFAGQEEINKIKKATAQPSLSMGTIRSIKMVLPDSIEEQSEIVSYLDMRCASIDALIAKKQQYLIEIENYKKSLIYEYVTGKKEVV